MTIKRYDIGRAYADGIGVPAITEQPHGAYVRHDDYLALADEWRAEKAGLEKIVMAQEVTIAELREGMEAVGAGGVSLMGDALAWQPVATAPKDGTDIMLTDGEYVTVGHWYHEEPSIREHRDLEGRWVGQDESDGYEGWLDWIGGIPATHWMPLPPAPPKEQS